MYGFLKDCPARALECFPEAGSKPDHARAGQGTKWVAPIRHCVRNPKGKTGT